MINRGQFVKGHTKTPILNKKTLISNFIVSLKSGTDISTSKMAKKFNLSNAQQAGRQLSQRTDVINVGRGKWRKI